MRASGTMPTGRRFARQQWEQGLRLYDYNARWCHPYIGRWIQPDTTIPDPANPQSLNRYSYCLNNPTRYLDPDGHFVIIPVLIAAGVVALKAVDYGWTAYDVYQLGRVLGDPNASRGAKLMAGLNVAMAAAFEAIKPDDALPVSLPLDDVGRRAVMAGAREAFQEGGEEALQRFVRDTLGVQADDPDLAEHLESALDAIADQLRAEPRWIEDVPEPEPVVTHDLEPVTVVHNGVQSEIFSAAEVRQQVEDTSRHAVVWNPEDIGVQYEDDVLWGSWAQVDQERSYRSAYADEGAWPRSVIRDLWDILIGAWGQVGGETEITEETQRVIDVMEVLADTLADEPDGAARTVARALATRVLKLGVKVKVGDDQLPHDALSEAFGWYLGVDLTYGWDAAVASAEGMDDCATSWVEKVAALRGVWPPQATAVSALVLYGASPAEARAAARATFLIA